MKITPNTAEELFGHKDDRYSNAEAEMEQPEATGYLAECCALEEPVWTDYDDEEGMEEIIGKF